VIAEPPAVKRILSAPIPEGYLYRGALEIRVDGRVFKSNSSSYLEFQDGSLAGVARLDGHVVLNGNAAYGELAAVDDPNIVAPRVFFKLGGFTSRMSGQERTDYDLSVDELQVNQASAAGAAWSREIILGLEFGSHGHGFGLKLAAPKSLAVWKRCAAIEGVFRSLRARAREAHRPNLGFGAQLHSVRGKFVRVLTRARGTAYLGVARPVVRTKTYSPVKIMLAISATQLTL